jgi:hypothetical protein
MFTDEVDGIGGFIVTGDDSKFIKSVCVVNAEDVVTGEETTVEDPIVAVLVTCVTDGIVEVD